MGFNGNRRRVLAALIGAMALGAGAQADVTPTGDAGLDGTTYYVGRSSDGTLKIDGSSNLGTESGYIGYLPDVSGQASITGLYSAWNNSAALYVGYGGAGALAVTDRGLVSCSGGYLGYAPGSSGQAVISGTNSHWSNPSDLYIGYSGAGALTVSAAAQITSWNGYIGYNAGSVGAVTVTGAQSSWTNSYWLYVGSAGSASLTVADGAAVTTRTLFASIADLHGNGAITATQGAILDADITFDAAHGIQAVLPFGSGGTLQYSTAETFGIGYRTAGTLHIADSKAVSSTDGYLGYRAGSIGTAVLSGGNWWNQKTLTIGKAGEGLLTATGQSLITAATATLGSSAGSKGTVNLTGSSARLSINTDLEVGEFGEGILNAEAGAQISSYTGSVGGGASSVGVVNLVGARWSNSHDIYVGGSGTGTLNLSAGANVSDSDYLYIGQGTGSTGAVNLAGTGTSWNCLEVQVGRQGKGALNVTSGAILQSGTGYLGYFFGSSGTATISGTGAQWQNSSDLYVGSGGAAILKIEAGGRVSDRYGYLRNQNASVVVSGAGSTWSHTYDLNIGEGELFILDGGLATNRDGRVADRGFAAGATVAGPGSKWVNTGNLYVGCVGIGSLSIERGGVVESPNTYIGYAQASGDMRVTGPGSQLSTTSLYLGRLQYGSSSLAIESGGRVSCQLAVLGDATGNKASVTVSGAGSSWALGGLTIGNAGSGSLLIESGGYVTSGSCVIGYQSGSAGIATVTGPGSKWSCGGEIPVGGSAVPGTLTIADGARIAAPSVRANAQGTINLHVSGDGMMTLGSSAGPGSISVQGALTMYADAFMPPGVYKPIVESAGRPMMWSGVEKFRTCGGLWNATSKTFTILPTAVGAAGEIGSNERWIFVDGPDNTEFGATFGLVPAGSTFSATLTSPDDLDALAGTPGFAGAILDAWTLATNLPSGALGAESMLSFDVGLGLDSHLLEIWHEQNGTWSRFTPKLKTYDSRGILSFTTTQYSSYAAVAVPEPASLATILLGAALCIRRRSRAAAATRT